MAYHVTPVCLFFIASKSKPTVKILNSCEASIKILVFVHSESTACDNIFVFVGDDNAPEEEYYCSSTIS